MDALAAGGSDTNSRLPRPRRAGTLRVGGGEVTGSMKSHKNANRTGALKGLMLAGIGLVALGAAGGPMAHAAPADLPAGGGVAVPLPSDALRGGPAEPLDPSDFERLGGSGQYKRCLDQVLTDPDAAFDIGLAWRDQGGGAPAKHCIALALIELGHYGEAAVRLETLAKAPDAGDTALRVQILSQAGNAWLLEEQAERAISALTAGIDLAATDPNAPVDATALIYDRARAHALIERWPETAADLTVVLERQPRSPSARVLRATARRHLGDIAAASDDIAAVLHASPEDAAALIERGLQASAQGDKDNARRDWAQAAVAGEGTPLADAARDLIARLDLIGETPGAPNAVARVSTGPAPVTTARAPAAPAAPARVMTASTPPASARPSVSTPIDAPDIRPAPRPVEAAPETPSPYAAIPDPVRRPDSARPSATTGQGITLRPAIGEIDSAF